MDGRGESTGPTGRARHQSPVFFSCSQIVSPVPFCGAGLALGDGPSHLPGCPKKSAASANSMKAPAKPQAQEAVSQPPVAPLACSGEDAGGMRVGGAGGSGAGGKMPAGNHLSAFVHPRAHHVRRPSALVEQCPRGSSGAAAPASSHHEPRLPSPQRAHTHINHVCMSGRALPAHQRKRRARRI